MTQIDHTPWGGGNSPLGPRHTVRFGRGGAGGTQPAMRVYLGGVLMWRAVLLAMVGVGLIGPAPATAKDGAAAFRAQCAVCHAVTANAPAGVGPRLFGVLGRRAGSVPGYAYSPAMKASGLTWTEDKLGAYLAAPQVVIKGNRMPFAGIAAKPDRDAIVAYLATLR